MESLSNLLSGGAEALGVGAETAGTIGQIAAPALTGAGLGAGTAAITGGDLGKGALIGGGLGLGKGAFDAVGGFDGISNFFTGGGATPGVQEGGVGVGGGGGPGAGTPSLPGGGMTPVAAGPSAVAAALPPGDPNSGDFSNVLVSQGAQPAGSELFNQGTTGGEVPGQVLDGKPAVPPSMAKSNGLTDFISKNPGALIGGAGLIAQATKGTTPVPAQGKLQGIADNAAGLGASLQNGQIPAGLQTGITTAVNSAKAATRSKFAQMGLTGSTMETQALNDIELQAINQQAQITQQLITQGLGQTQLASHIYQQLMQQQLQDDNELSSAIGNFAAAAAGGFGGGQRRAA